MNDRSFASTPKGQEARSEILNAAWKLFIQKGYTSTSLRDIARLAGNRAVAGVYNHFSSKEALFQALLQRAAPVEEFRTLIEGCRGETAPELIRSYLLAWLPLAQRHYAFLKLVQIDQEEFGGVNVEKIFPELRMSLDDFARVIQSLPGLRPMPRVVLLRLLEMVSAGYTVTARYGPEDERAVLTGAEWVDHIVRALLHGIAEPPE